MLSFPALLLLVGIGAVGLYLALPRGPESEPRPVRLAGLGLGIACVVFLTAATAGRLPDEAPSRLGGLPWAVYFALASGSVIAAGAAVTARSGRWLIAAAAGLLLATAGLLGMLGSSGAAWVAAVLGVAAAGAAVWLGTGGEIRAGDAAAAEVCREPVLACLAGGFLAAGLVTVAHAASVEELPRTLSVEAGRPPSLRYRALPRRSVIERVTVRRQDGERGSHGEAADLPLLHHSLVFAVLLVAVGTSGVLTRRSPIAVGAATAAALTGVALAIGAFGALHGDLGRPALAILPLALVPVHAGLLAVRHSGFGLPSSFGLRPSSLRAGE